MTIGRRRQRLGGVLFGSAEGLRVAVHVAGSRTAIAARASDAAGSSAALHAQHVTLGFFVESFKRTLNRQITDCGRARFPPVVRRSAERASLAHFGVTVHASAACERVQLAAVRGIVRIPP